MTRYRFEVWDRANAIRLAVLSTAVSARRRQVLRGEETLDLHTALDDPAAAEITEGAVIRIYRGGTTEASLWRVVGPTAQRTPSGERSATWACDALWLDLRHGLVVQPHADGRDSADFGLLALKPADYLNSYILPGYAGTDIAFVAGTIDPAVAFVEQDLHFRNATPLAALRQLEDAFNCEVAFTPSASKTTYIVDILERVGAIEGTAELRYRKNLPGARRTRDEADVQTRIYARGSGTLGLGDAEWAVGNYAGNVVTFPLDRSPVFADDAFIGARFVIPGKGAYAITASAVAARSLTLVIAGGGTPEPGDIGHFETAEGRRIAYLEHPLGLEQYGIRVGQLQADDVPDAINLLHNPTLDFIAPTLPAGWAAIGEPTISNETDRRYARNGTSAARVLAEAEDEGLASAPFIIPAREDRPYLGILAGMTVLSGDVRLELLHSNGERYPIQERPQNDGRNVYITLSAGPVHPDPLPEGTATLRVLSHGGPAEFILDAAMATPQLSDAVPAFVAGSGAHALWFRTAAELEERRHARVEYDLTLADLHAADPQAFPYDRLVLGDTVQIRDPDVGNASMRIVELATDLLQPADTHLVLAESARRRIDDPHRPAFGTPGVGSYYGITGSTDARAEASILSYSAAKDPEDGLVYIAALGDARTATMQLFRKDNRTDPWPDEPAATIVGRRGIFEAQEVAKGSALYYRIVPYDGSGGAGRAEEDAYGTTLATHVLGLLNIEERQISPTEYEIKWIDGPQVAFVFIYDRLHSIPEPEALWPPTPEEVEEGAAPELPTTTLERGVRRYVAEIPKVRERRRIQLEGRSETLRGGPVYRTTIDAPPPVVNAELRAELNGPTLDLYLDVRANPQAYPITATIREGAKTGPVLAAFTLEEDGTTGPDEFPMLGGRQRPSTGRKVWWALLVDVAGTRRWLEVDAVAENALPHIEVIAWTKGPRIFDLSLRVIDPTGEPGTLRAWRPNAFTGQPDVEASPSGMIQRPSTPFTLGPGVAWDTGGNVLADIEKGLDTNAEIALEFTSNDGRTTGIVRFPMPDIRSSLMDRFGNLQANTILGWHQFAEGLRGWAFVETQAGLTPALGELYAYALVRDDETRWALVNGAWVETEDVPMVAAVPIMLSGIVKTSHLETATLDGILNEAEGRTQIIVDAELVNWAGTAGFNINAGAGQAFLHHAAMTLYGPGSDPLGDWRGSLHVSEGVISGPSGTIYLDRAVWPGEASAGGNYMFLGAIGAEPVWKIGDLILRANGEWTFPEGITNPPRVISVGAVIADTGSSCSSRSKVNISWTTENATTVSVERIGDSPGVVYSGANTGFFQDVLPWHQGTEFTDPNKTVTYIVNAHDAAAAVRDSKQAFGLPLTFQHAIDCP
jgi:hypothetical protein